MQHKVLIVDDSKLARMVMVSAFRRIRPDWEPDRGDRCRRRPEADFSWTQSKSPLSTSICRVPMGWNWSRRSGNSSDDAGGCRLRQYAGRDNRPRAGT